MCPPSKNRHTSPLQCDFLFSSSFWFNFIFAFLHCVFSVFRCLHFNSARGIYNNAVLLFIYLFIFVLSLFFCSSSSSFRLFFVLFCSLRWRNWVEKALLERILHTKFCTRYFPVVADYGGAWFKRDASTMMVTIITNKYVCKLNNKKKRNNIGGRSTASELFFCRLFFL